MTARSRESCCAHFKHQVDVFAILGLVLEPESRSLGKHMSRSAQQKQRVKSTERIGVFVARRGVRHHALRLEDIAKLFELPQRLAGMLEHIVGEYPVPARHDLITARHKLRG